MLPPRTIRVALLVCGEFTKKILAEHGDYLAVYRRWLKSSLPRRSGITLAMDGYDVFREKYPQKDQIPKYDAVMLTGSPANAGSNDPWINRLVNFVQHVGDDHPQIRIYGICLGHQIVCRALGGRVEQNKRGWEIGWSTVHTTHIGKSILGVDRLEMPQIHRDHVPLDSLPNSHSSGGVHILGGSDRTGNQGLVKFYPFPSEPDRQALNLMEQVHVLTVQGHPEFNESIVTGIAHQMLEEGVIDNDMMSMRSLKQGEDGDTGPWTKGNTEKRWKKHYDGTSIVGNAFWRTLGVDYGRYKRA